MVVVRGKSWEMEAPASGQDVEMHKSLQSQLEVLEAIHTIRTRLSFRIRRLCIDLGITLLQTTRTKWWYTTHEHGQAGQAHKKAVWEHGRWRV